jgi:cell division protein FtsW
MAQVGAHYLIMQLTWCAVGLTCCGAALAVDYKILKPWVWPLFGLAMVLLVAVLVPHVGLKIKGARRWLGFGPVRLQASEFAKLALIMAVAWYGERYQRKMGTFKRGILIPGVFIGMMLALIFVEPDRGTTILLGAVTGIMLLIAGVQWKYIVPPVVLALGGLAYSLIHDPMRTKRIFSWLYLEENKSGVGYQAYQAMLALGAGGWTGLGLGNGRQKLGFIPEHHTDFIFSVIGEELGLIATLLVVLAFVAIVLSGIYISLNAREPFGVLLGCGITFLIGMQAFINIGVVTGALPNKGMALPFISYGGSNLMVMLAAVGVLLSIARQVKTKEAPSNKAAVAEGLAAAQPA